MHEETREGGATADSAVHQACGDVAGRPAIRGLGVSDGAVLLSEVQSQLTLVSEVKVTFFTLKKRKTL